MADKKAKTAKELSEEEMKKNYKLMLNLGLVEMADDLKLLEPESTSPAVKPEEKKNEAP